MDVNDSKKKKGKYGEDPAAILGPKTHGHKFFVKSYWKINRIREAGGNQRGGMPAPRRGSERTAPEKMRRGVLLQVVI